MRRKLISMALCMSIAATLSTGYTGMVSAAEVKTPKYQTTAREMERLDRGLVAVKTTADSGNQAKNGVYLTWRLLGTESLTNQAFDIYENGNYKTTTAADGATNYFIPNASGTATYQVVPQGKSKDLCTAVTPINFNRTARGSLANNGTSEKNSYTYFDIPIERPDDYINAGGRWSYYHNTLTSDGSVAKEGGANDASVGDLDGDGDYEIILKWDPTDSKDSAGSDYTGYTYFDAYDFDINTRSGDNNNVVKSTRLWRINLGPNVTSGQHYSPFMVYDFDGDGKAEFAVKTAPGTKDALGNYVTDVGDTDAIRKATDNEHIYVTEGSATGKNTTGPEYLTIFDGETGKALATTDYIPRGKLSDWGDSKANRSERYLGGVAYLDGVHPSLIMCRGYYAKAVIRAYDWDGETLSLRWEHNGNVNKSSTMYGQGNHNLTIADVDNDGKDEIVYGSATLDDDGKTMIDNTRLGHGDAMHVNDFDNDGYLEVFSVKEDPEGYKKNAANFRRPYNGKGGDTTIWGKGASGDTGRGVMDNIDDEYAKTNPDAMALAWSSSHANVFTLSGKELKAHPATSSRSMTNFLVYWDGDLSREILDDNQLAKYHADTGYTTRFYDDGNGYLPLVSNNSSKHVPSLVADILGDWREEIIAPYGKGPNDNPVLRVFISTLPSDYRLTTLMHDSQYRTAIAWQNVAYNQPPHQSYYIGSAALATDESGKTLNYLAPETAFTSVTEPAKAAKDPVTGLTLSESSIKVEKGSTAIITANITPDTASKKVNWSSSDPTVATVSNGVITGIKNGTTTITATSPDTTNGTFSATCQVEVYSTPVTGLTVPYGDTTVFIGGSKTIAATVVPENATDRGLTWTSSNENVATVNANGTVTGVSIGSAIITAKTNDGGIEKDVIVTVLNGNIEDVTGENTFVTGAESEGTTYKSAADSASIVQTDAQSGAEVYKDFEVYEDNKATIYFRIDTGGQRIHNEPGATPNPDTGIIPTMWNWNGNEYTFGLQFLDENENNILTLSQSYTNKAQMTQSTIGAEMTQNVGNDWTQVLDGSNNPFGRSTTRWDVKLEFDYDSDTCVATLQGDRRDAEKPYDEYTTTFDLNGAHFKRLRYYTTKDSDGKPDTEAYPYNETNGGIYVKPSISLLSYMREELPTGYGNSLYEKGTTSDTAWSASDLSDWAQTNTDTARLEVDTTENRIRYNPTKPGSSYDATKTFDITDGALVTYDVDWHFGSQVGAGTEHYEYIQFGSNLRLGWKQDYKVWLSKDAGNTWSANAIFSGSNGTFTKNIQLVADTSTNTVQYLKFDNNIIADCTDYTLPEGDKVNAVKFGFYRANSSTLGWGYPNGIAKITALQFTEGAIAPTPEPTESPSQEPSESPSPTPGGGNVDPPATPTTGATDEPTTPTPTTGVTDEPTTPTPTTGVTAPPATETPDTGETPEPVPTDIPDIQYVFEITETGSASVDYKLNSNKDIDNPILIAALYDSKDTVKQVKIVTIGNVTADLPVTGTVEFNSEFESQDSVKLFVWHSIKNMKPIFSPAYKKFE
ncbi:MAG: Ig-like domain-containing protein [Oscillospiraceae bacterium]|nr:Ig-like domain-containing protein [Oscillospiraceae bacterium]